MKRKYLLGLVLLMSVGLFTGCGQVTGECVGCKKEAPLYELDAVINGEKSTDILCEDCVDIIVEAADTLNKYAPGTAEYSIKKYKGR